MVFFLGFHDVQMISKSKLFSQAKENKALSNYPRVQGHYWIRPVGNILLMCENGCV